MVEILERLDVKKSLSAGKWLFLFLKTRGAKKMENELRLMINWFEKKVDEAEKEYKEKHKEDFDVAKMKKSVNRKLKVERETLIKVNMLPSALILENTKRFKY